MAKPLFEILSTTNLRRHAQNPEAGLGFLARELVNILDATGEADAEAKFCEVMRDYFYNLAASSKRKHADALAIAFCEERSGFDDLWEYLKAAGVTGRTRAPV